MQSSSTHVVSSVKITAMGFKGKESAKRTRQIRNKRANAKRNFRREKKSPGAFAVRKSFAQDGSTIRIEYAGKADNSCGRTDFQTNLQGLLPFNSRRAAKRAGKKEFEV